MKRKSTQLLNMYKNAKNWPLIDRLQNWCHHVAENFTEKKEKNHEEIKKTLIDRLCKIGVITQLTMGIWWCGGVY